MHLRIVMIGTLAIFCVTAVFSPKTASTAEEEVETQDVLAECPIWSWGASEIPGVFYELCFDDIDHCIEAYIGDEVCIPSMGPHDVWVTAIDHQGADPVYYDGEMASIDRIRSADFDDSGLVGFSDVFHFFNDLGKTGEMETDVDGNLTVDFVDFFLILDAFGKCISHTGYLYDTC